MIYCEMLGHPVPWGYINALNLTQDEDVVLKKAGFLAACLFLDENSDLMILMIHSLQKVLVST